MTPEELQHLRALCEKATPGPWCVQGPHPQATIYVEDEAIHDDRIAPTRVATIATLCPPGTSTADDPDARFIAAARAALPRLLDECERLRHRAESAETGVLDHGIKARELGDECERLRAERSADVANLREGHCLAVIPGTFIACGEGGNYCSETCRLRKLLAEACSLLESDHRPFAPDGSRGTEQIEREARIAAIRREGGVK